MKKINILKGLLFSLPLLAIPTFSPVSFAEEAEEEVVVVGSRRDARSVGDSPAPVDVISGSDFVNQSAKTPMEPGPIYGIQ